MKNYIRSALDTLTALDFHLDHEDRKIRTDRWIFTHANAPDERLTLNFKMSEQAARTVVQRAKQIVGLATSDATKRAPKANQRAKAERATLARQREAARLLADAKHAERIAAQESARIANRRRELDRLMRGDDSAAPVVSIRPDQMLTVAEVADQTGLTDKAVQRAIESGRLEAYQCGRDVKVKGADVRDWLAAS